MKSCNEHNLSSNCVICIKVGYVESNEGVLAVLRGDADHCIKGPYTGTTESKTEVSSPPSGAVLQWTYLRDKDNVCFVACKSRIPTIYDASFSVYLNNQIKA